MLVLEIEFLSGVCYAAVGPDSHVPDWPPQPDRIFSALVATWALRGQEARETSALQWLERLPPPRIEASETEPRTSAMAFVPPNDPSTAKQKNARGVFPAFRRRQPRRFPASRPHASVLRLMWDEVADTGDNLDALDRLARDTAYVGHSTSLTRCRFYVDPHAPENGARMSPQRRVYEGRLDELQRAFAGGRRSLSGARVVRPSEAPRPRTNTFGERWLLLEHIDGRMPDLRASAIVARTIRDVLLSAYARSGLGEEVPEVVSGHRADGTPTDSPHLAIVPLAFAGFPHADGHVMGFAVVPPHASSILDDDDFRRALRAVAPVDEDRGRRVLPVISKRGTSEDRAFSLALSPTFEPPRRSLDPALYTRSARVFATVTPLVLDRHLKARDHARQAEVELQIAAACRRIGLPEPEVVVADKHSTVEGVPAAYPSSKSPAWMRWLLPPSLATRQLTHAVVRFTMPVEGPLILGAGRYFGLGLCRPLDGRNR
jgi:CRISPR-associated protein Csb2